MRDEFFGDDRDLLKWSLVLDLAGSDLRILYVPMCRPDERMTKFEGAIRADVGRFFRINRMRSVIGLLPDRFDVVSWDEYCDRERIRYFGAVCKFLNERDRTSRSVVFVDPDTGIAPANVSSQHVRGVQLATLWCCLRPDDVLVVYQHAPQNRVAGWADEKAVLFAEAVGIPNNAVQRKSALDVCFLWAKK